MHPNPRFHWDHVGEMRAFVASRGFAHLCVSSPTGRPVVAHAPVIVTETGNLRFHLARSNRIIPHLERERVLASVTNADHYVSPDWYGTQDQVPTWNYLAVEVEGRAHRLDEAELIDQIDQLSAVFEGRLMPKRPWTRAKMSPGKVEAMLGAIHGFELEASEWRGTRKLGQNKTTGERRGVAQALDDLGLRMEAELVRMESL